ncbi:MAG: hypothetical protein EOO89_09505 [Pedobacter sp.]|nr:MAG: hypothetical protein EOO89_09505 [Pedobacter sp.]
MNINIKPVIHNLCLFMLTLFGLNAQAQFNQVALEHRLRPDSLSRGFSVDLYNFNFVRNYEFFNNLQDGYTLYGTQLMPQLVYSPNAHLLLSAGAYFRKDFGSRGIYEIEPLFSLKYNKDNLTLIFGALEGNVNHRYVDPLFDLERKLVSPIEYGTQLVIEKKNLFIDTWISWEKMIYKPSPVQEVISGGISAERTITDKNNFKVSLPVQFIATHEGGQIDTGNTPPLTTLFNGAVGIKLRKTLSGNGAFRDVFTDNYLIAYKDFSPIKRRAFESGLGVWLNVGVTTKIGTFVASYLDASGFISIKGMPLLQSVSQNVNHPGYAEKNRKVFMLRHSMQKELVKNLFLDLRLEPHINLNSPGANRIDFSNSIFLSYKQQFSLQSKKGSLSK